MTLIEFIKQHNGLRKNNGKVIFTKEKENGASYCFCICGDGTFITLNTDNFTNATVEKSENNGKTFYKAVEVVSDDDAILAALKGE